MISAAYTEGEGFCITDTPIPEIGPDDVLLRVQAASICATDVKIARCGHNKLAPGQRIVLGHEFVGVIEKCGDRVHGLAPGMRVGAAPNWGCGRCRACIRGMANLCPDFSAFGINTDGAQAPYVRIPGEAIAQGNVVELPANVPWDEASLAEPVSCVLNAQKVVSVAPGETVLIYGAGPMGMLHLLMARAIGASTIVMIDRNPKRLAKALELGADEVIDNSVESVAQRLSVLRGDQGADVAIIAVPVRELAQEALGLLAPFGRLCLFAGLRGDVSVTLDGNAIHYRNLYVTGTTGGAAVDYRAAVALIASRRVDVRPVISHRFPFTQLKEAYDVAMGLEGLKIVLTAEN